MVIVGTVHHIDVQCDSCVECKGTEKFFRQAGVILSDHSVGECPLEYQERAVADVQAAKCQRLVHGNECTAVACDAGLVAQRLTQRLSQDDAGVLDGMVTVHIEVTLYGNVHADAAVNRQCGQHMVKKADAGVDVCGSHVVQFYGHLYVCLFGLSCKLCLPHMDSSLC